MSDKIKGSLIAGECNGYIIYYWKFAKLYYVTDQKGNRLFSNKTMSKVIDFCKMQIK